MSAHVRLRSTAATNSNGNGAGAGAGASASAGAAEPPSWFSSPRQPSSTSSSSSSTTPPSANRNHHHSHHHHHHHHQQANTVSSSSLSPSPQSPIHANNITSSSSLATAAGAREPCKCSQCDPNFYTIPIHMLFNGKVEYVCRDCQLSTLSYQAVQLHESTSGHRRWYNYPQ